jgi:hypothetical protein
LFAELQKNVRVFGEFQGQCVTVFFSFFECASLQGDSLPQQRQQ